MEYGNIFNADFDQDLGRLMKRWRVPGCAIGLVPLNQRPILKTYNQDDICAPISSLTPFPVASCTKLVSALALLRALEGPDHINPLETRIKDILPEFRLSDAEASEKCAIKDILTHRCNVPPFNAQMFRPFEDGMNSLKLVAGLPIIAPLREGPPLYSTVMTQLMYPMIERLTGKTYELYVRETILEPLGMSSSTYWASKAGDDLALGFQARHGPDGIETKMMALHHPFVVLGKESGISTVRLISTIEDMAKLLAHLPTVPLFSEMSLPFASDRPEGVELPGTGTISIPLDGRLMSGHTGACAGFRSHILHVPSLNYGIVVLANSTEGLDLALWIESWVMGSIQGNRAELCDRIYNQIEADRREFHKMVTSDCPAVKGTGCEKLIGTFNSSTFGSITFVEEDNLPIRPAGSVMSMPWLPHLYGSTRPKVTSMGAGTFEGCLEWTAGEHQGGWVNQYGNVFTACLDQGGEQLRVRGMGWEAAFDKKDPEAVYHRIVEDD